RLLSARPAPGVGPQRLPPRPDELLGDAARLEELDRVLEEPRTLVDARRPDVRRLARVALEVVQLRRLRGSANDQRPARGGDGDRHVARNPARPRVDGARELALGEVERPGADDE